MPFKSQAQRRFMYARHPELAKKFEKETPKGKKLPEKVKKKKVAEEAFGQILSGSPVKKVIVMMPEMLDVLQNENTKIECWSVYDPQSESNKSYTLYVYKANDRGTWDAAGQVENIEDEGSAKKRASELLSNSEVMAEWQMINLPPLLKLLEDIWKKTEFSRQGYIVPDDFKTVKRTLKLMNAGYVKKSGQNTVRSTDEGYEFLMKQTGRPMLKRNQYGGSYWDEGISSDIIEKRRKLRRAGIPASVATEATLSGFLNSIIKDKFKKHDPDDDVDMILLNRMLGHIDNDWPVKASWRSLKGEDSYMVTHFSKRWKREKGDNRTVRVSHETWLATVAFMMRNRLIKVEYNWSEHHDHFGEFSAQEYKHLSDPSNLDAFFKDPYKTVSIVLTPAGEKMMNDLTKAEKADYDEDFEIYLRGEGVVSGGKEKAVVAPQFRMAKRTQETANYRPSDDAEYKCGSCQHREKNGCELVEGTIQDDYYCNFFDIQTQTEATLGGFLDDLTKSKGYKKEEPSLAQIIIRAVGENVTAPRPIYSLSDLYHMVVGFENARVTKSTITYLVKNGTLELVDEDFPEEDASHRISDWGQENIGYFKVRFSKKGWRMYRDLEKLDLDWDWWETNRSGS